MTEPNVIKFQRRTRAVICEGCGCSYLTREVIPFGLCDSCEVEAEALQWEQWDAQARSRGFASADDEYQAYLRGETA